MLYFHIFSRISLSFYIGILALAIILSTLMLRIVYFWGVL